MDSFEGMYYYDRLSEEEKIVYAEIYYYLINRIDEGRLSSTDIKQIEKVYNYLINDHPEIFYVSGYTYRAYSSGDTIVYITFSGSYTMDENEVITYEDAISNYLGSCMRYVEDNSESSDEYGTIKAVYDFIIKNTEYNIDSKYNQSIVSVAAFGESVCRGYAKMFQYILNKCYGIEVTSVTGRIKDGTGHEWNLVRLGENYYYVDPTWGDDSFSEDDFSFLGNVSKDMIPQVSYFFFMVPERIIEETHEFDNKEIMPVCDSIEEFYFYKTGAYFTDVDDTQLKTLFNKAYENKDKYIILMMDSDSTYKKMRKYLLDNQKIFGFLDKDSVTVNYAECPDRYYILFWL